MKGIVQWNPVYDPGTSTSIGYRLIYRATGAGRSEREVARRRRAAAYDFMWLSNGDLRPSQDKCRN